MASFDFFHELRDDIPYNLHSHTQFCDGRASMEEMAAAAMAEGFSHWGFSPHSPVPLTSPCNMAADNVTAYLSEAERLRNIYRGRMKIYAAMEIDYLGPDWGPSHPFFTSLPLDYCIGSVHIIPTQDGNRIDVDGSPARFAQYLKEHFHNDLDYVVSTYFKQSLAMVKAGGFEIIGHLDKLRLNASAVRHDIESSQCYRTGVETLIHEIILTGITVEINTKHYEATGRFFPAPELWQMLRGTGVPIVVNSDAHHPHLISASRTEAIRMLRQTAGA